MILFAYGTLRRGCANHDRFASFAERFERETGSTPRALRFLGHAHVPGRLMLPPHTMVPFLVAGGGIVAGDLFDVDDRLIGFVDLFEHGYERRPVLARVAGNPRLTLAQAYFWPTPLPPEWYRPSGDYAREVGQ